MKILETSKFQKLRKRTRSEIERSGLKKAIAEIEKNPDAGKKLKGEFAPLRSLAYSVKGQPRRLIYRWEKNEVVLFSLSALYHIRDGGG